MILNRISIVNFKNIKAADLELSPKMNCFIGLNGAGKTNFLDAVYYLSFCHGVSGSPDSQLIKHDEDFFMLEGNYDSSDEVQDVISCAMKKGRKKHFKRNGKDYRKLSQHIGLIPLILISPSDISLVIGGGEERRKFMDVAISQYDHTYLSALMRYDKALQQRNALLRGEAEPDATLLDVLEDEMARQGNILFDKRDNFIERLIPVFQEIYQDISDCQEEISLKYVSHAREGDLLEILRSGRARDRAVGHSLHGAHRDDLEMLIGGYPLKREGSQGQLKSFVLSLKLAQFDFLRQKSDGIMPLLLLDDIFDKLDVCRVERIVRLVSGRHFGQIFITDTNRDHLDGILRQGDGDYRIFLVDNGNIVEKSE
ncbi:MAG: DNA replication/repair protein RecF [Prevotella sp.]|nr:DNA replication/repair protein RecF [Prevotella sp.]MCH4182012.1 DNA replication/repair protein RecF [Prevotella sp.]MCH4211846.1 DNA replication/repair protein RecF [Prevotella sp.]MCH4240974.1 DNA replication/repair protein RecF [Prevotella sp.]